MTQNCSKLICRSSSTEIFNRDRLLTLYFNIEFPEPFAREEIPQASIIVSRTWKLTFTSISRSSTGLWVANLRISSIKCSPWKFSFLSECRIKDLKVARLLKKKTAPNYPHSGCCTRCFLPFFTKVYFKSGGGGDHVCMPHCYSTHIWSDRWFLPSMVFIINLNKLSLMDTENYKNKIDSLPTVFPL